MKVILDSLEINPVIYGIKCKINDKIYIGKAKNHYERLGLHIRRLNEGKHHCKQLQEDYIRYGAINFIFTILHEAKEEENINLLEIHYISQINPEKLYNSRLMKNKIVSFDALTGEILHHYFNIAQASLETGISMTQIYSCCIRHNNAKTAKGVGFCFESDINTISELIKDKRKTNSGGNGRNKIKIKCYKDNILINEFESQTQAAILLNVRQPLINMCLKGKIKQTGGYTFQYA